MLISEAQTLSTQAPQRKRKGPDLAAGRASAPAQNHAGVFETHRLFEQF
jgi:hypothetical protein